MFAVTPAAADLGTFNPKVVKLGSLVVKNYADESVSLLGVESTIKGLHAVIDVLEAGHAWRLRVTVDPSLTGPIDGTLKIKTSSRKFPVVEVSIKGTAVPSRP